MTLFFVFQAVQVGYLAYHVFTDLFEVRIRD